MGKPKGTFAASLERARVPMDVAVLWSRRTDDLHKLSAKRQREAWELAVRRVTVLRAELDVAKADATLRGALALIEGEHVLPAMEEAPVESDAMGTLHAAVSDARDMDGVARALLDLEPKLREQNAFEAARSLCVDRIKELLKSKDFAGCSSLLDATIKRVRNEPPDGGGARAVPIAPAADAVEEETLGGAGSLLASASKAERETFEVLREKIARKHESYSIAVSFASRREELGSLRPLAKGLTVLRLQRVLGNEQDAEATLEGVVRHWDERMRRAA